MTESAKSQGAFLTIGELSRETGLPQHILRYWETRFQQLKPLTRAGNRRYYRPADVLLVRRIDQALNRDGYTVRGVQQLLDGDNASDKTADRADGDPLAALRAIRALLAGALADDAS